MPGWSPVHTFQEASQVSTQVMQGLVDALIWLVLIFWPFVLLAVIAVFIFRAVMRRRKYSEKASNTPPAPES
jgi:hypothetical protein